MKRRKIGLSQDAPLLSEQGLECGRYSPGLETWPSGKPFQEGGFEPV